MWQVIHCGDTAAAATKSGFGGSCLTCAAGSNLGFAFVGRDDLLRGGEIMPPSIRVCACQPGAAPVAYSGVET